MEVIRICLYEILMSGNSSQQTGLVSGYVCPHTTHWTCTFDKHPSAGTTTRPCLVFYHLFGVTINETHWLLVLSRRVAAQQWGLSYTRKRHRIQNKVLKHFHSSTFEAMPRKKSSLRFLWHDLYPWGHGNFKHNIWRLQLLGTLLLDGLGSARLAAFSKPN